MFDSCECLKADTTAPPPSISITVSYPVQRTPSTAQFNFRNFTTSLDRRALLRRPEVKSRPYRDMARS